MTDDVWQALAAEARDAFRGAGRFPLRAYSEFMPAPFVGVKPYQLEVADGVATAGASRNALEIDEYEQAHDLEPGFDRIADHVVHELGRLMRGEPHALSKTLLDGNPAWPAELADAARAGTLADDPIAIAMALALSRSQDDKGNARWTLFGTSHDGAAPAFWHGLDRARLDAILGWAGTTGGWKILARADEVPAALHGQLIDDAAPIDGLACVVTFRPFATLPAAIRAAYLARELALFPCPASLVFFEHPRYRELASKLPRATQIPLLHLFPRVEGSCAIRIPQSGWLDETGTGEHKVVDRVARTHRWQRVARDAGIADGVYLDKVSVALFSTDADVLGLYDKPLAKNCEIWTAEYELVLDGPRADRGTLERAAVVVDAGGRFGYRMMYPPMRGGMRALFWHVPMIARAHGGGRNAHAPHGYVTAERDGMRPFRLEPKLLARASHVTAATKFERDPGHLRHTTSSNVRKLLEAHELLGPLPASFARALLRIAKRETLDDWLDALTALVPELRACLDAVDDPGASHVLTTLGTRKFEEQIWHSISGLAEGEFRQKENADGIAINTGRTGGPAAAKANIVAHERRDLEALGDHLHARYRALIAEHGVGEVVDHAFRWETDFAFPWMEGWAKNQAGAPRERNIVMMIPGRRRDEAVIMGDHYDTAYMEDVYDADRGGDMLRAPALGADDNHSATTALLLAAERLLPLAKAGKLERDVWLVHLTGEEFPADSLGARAICQGLVEHHLVFTAEDGSPRDVSHVRVAGAYVLDMIGHNTERDRDVFQIAPGEGRAALGLALRAQRATERWNRSAATWNHHAARASAGRAQRMPDGSSPPPMFAHLQVHGEVRVEWEATSSLYNTDGQAFSDVGVPFVLFMENYDISRTGYHDTLDTMANIDLDYCAALTAIAIESVADAACALDL